MDSPNTETPKQKSPWKSFLRLIVAIVAATALLVVVVSSLPTCKTENATGTQFTRKGKIVDAHTYYLKQLRYSTTFSFEEPLPSGDYQAECGNEDVYLLCENREGSYALVTFDADGYVSSAELL